MTVRPLQSVAATPSRFARGSSIKTKRVEWAWRPWLPLGFLTFVDGVTSIGKSTLIADLVRSFTTGEPFATDAVRHQPHGAVVLSEDPPDYVTAPRFIAAGATMDRVAIFEKREPLILPRDIRDIENAVRDVQARLVVIDPLVDFVEQRRRLVVDQEIAPVLSSLQSLAETHQLAVLLVRHWTKGAASNAVDRGAGGTRIGSACRVGWTVAPDPDATDDPGARVLACAKSNLGGLPRAICFRLNATPGEDHPVIEWLGESDATANELATGETAKGEKRGKVEDCADWLLGQLAGGRHIESATIFEAAKAAGFGRDTCYQAKDRIGVRATKAGGPSSPWHWFLPAEALR